jgi:predicted DNA-binding protein (UPF0251 family)
MPRPRKRRRCKRFDGDRVMKPRGIPMTDVEIIRLDLDELEAMRLCDVERYEQSAAGEKMRVSRGTVQRLLKSGREKTVRSILESAALVIGDDD